MSIDNVFVHFTADEMRSKALNGRVNSVKQIDRDSFLFGIHINDENFSVLMNCNPLTSRVCITENSYSFTDKPSNFMLLLKKYLTGKRISAVEQLNNDRIIRFSFIGSNQFGDEKLTYLYAELIGNNTNLILCDNSGILIDSLKKKEYSDTSGRAVLPGMLYRFPLTPSGYVLPGLDAGTVRELIAESDSYERFISRIYGISAKVKSTLTSYSEFLSFTEYVRRGRIEYYCYGSDKGMKAVSYVPLKEYENLSCTVFDSPSKAFDFYYRLLDFEQKNSLLTKKISSTVSVLLNRKKKKLEKLESDLAECAAKDNILHDAELLKANIFLAHKGDRYIKCTDYYSEDLNEVVLEIDPLKEPSAYLASLYKKYSKYKTAETVLESEIKKCTFEIEYLDSVLDEINRASDDCDVREIEKELISAGYIKKADNRKNTSRSEPLKVYAPSGKEIIIGRNNAQNDELTFKKAFRDDLWFHVKAHHGSHVILRSSGNGFSERDIIAAAEYAAYYSQARNSGKTAVDYTAAANVHRNSPYYPGRVIYTEFKTVIVASDGDVKK